MLEICSLVILQHRSCSCYSVLGRIPVYSGINPSNDLIIFKFPITAEICRIFGRLFGFVVFLFLSMHIPLCFLPRCLAAQKHFSSSQTLKLTGYSLLKIISVLIYFSRNQSCISYRATEVWLSEFMT